MASTLTEALQQQNLQNSEGAPAAGFHAPPATLTQALQQQNAVAMPAQGVMADLPPQFAPPETLSLGQVFSSRLMEGVDQTQQLGGGLMRMLGRSLGSATIETFGQNIIDNQQAEIDAYLPSVHSLGEIENFDDFLEWAVGGFGQAIPSLATAFAGGGVGAVVGRQVVKRSIAKKMAGDGMELATKYMGKKQAQAAISRAMNNPTAAKMLKDAISKGVARDLRRGTMYGGGAGTFLPSSGMMTGEAELAGVKDPLLALGVGVAGGILETAVLGRFVSRMFPGVDRKVANNFIKDFAKGTGTQAALEGGQEGAQELIQQAALAYHDPSFDMLDPQNVMQVIDSFAIGALVGTVMGAGGEAVGQTTTRLRERGGSADPTDGEGPIPPTPGPTVGPNNGFPPDFEPADNTLTEEITGRINDILGAHVTPALNVIQNQIKDIYNKVTGEMPNVRSSFKNIVQPVQAAHDEFVAGNEPVIDEITRYAGEQVAYIVETAEGMNDPVARQKFIEEELAAVEEEIAGVAEEMAERGNQVAESSGNQVRQMHVADVFENDMTMGGVSDPEFTFGQNERLRTRQGVPYQRPTRGDRAKPFETRESAETWMKRLQTAYPSANEDSFEVIETPKGEGFLIQLADQLQRDQLLEDEVVTNGLQNARTSARGNKDESRKVRLENKTTIDVPTLAFQGRRLDRGDDQSLTESFAAITGRLLDRGIITDEDFVNMSRVFEKHFPKDLQLANVRMVAERQAAIDRGDFKPTGPREPEPETKAQAARRQQKEHERNARLDFEAMSDTERHNVTRVINEQIDRNPPNDERKRGAIFNKYLVVAMNALNQDPNALRNLDTELARVNIEKGYFELYDAKEDAAKGLDGADRTHLRVGRWVDTDPNVDDDRFPAKETEEDQLQRSRDKRNPKERDMPQQPYDPNAPRSDVGRAIDPKLLERKKRLEQSIRELADSMGRLDMSIERQLEIIDSIEQPEEGDLNFPEDYADSGAVVRQEYEKLEQWEQQQEENYTELGRMQDLLQKTNEQIANPKARKKGQKSPATPRDVMRARQRARLENEAARDKAQKEKRRPKKRKKPIMRTPSPKVATRKPKKSAKARSVVWLPGAPKQQQEAIQELVERVLNLLPESATELRVINREAYDRMVKKNHPHALMLDGLEHIQIAAVLPGINGLPTYMVIPEVDNMIGYGMSELAAEAHVPIGLIHELGHHLHYETWASLSREAQDKLIAEFRKDVASGNWESREPAGQTMAWMRGEESKMLDTSLEFQEWMADQLVEWMTTRRQPKTAVEKFMHKVAIRIQQMWDYIAANPRRYGVLNESYGEFVDALAKRVRQPGYGNDFWFRNGGRTRRSLILSKNLEPLQFREMSLSPQQVDRVRRGLENYPRIATNANKMIEWMTNAYRVALAPSTSFMRTLSKNGITAADKLVRMFSRQPHGASKVGRTISQNYHQAKEMMQGQFAEKMKQILKGASEAELFRLGQELRAMDGNPDMVPTTLRGRAIRKLLDEMHEYSRKAGLPVGKVPNYFPRIFDREKLLANEQEVIEYLTRAYLAEMSPRQQQEDPGAAEAKARRIFNSITSTEADADAAMRELERDPLATQAPAGGFMRSRTASDEFFGEYYNDNVEAVMANYINAVVKRAEYNRLLGQQASPQQVGGDANPRSQWDPRAKLKAILREARDQGATPDELQYMKKYVEANLGMYGRDDITDGQRKVLATILAYQNMRTLLFSVFASLPDAMGPAIRSGSMRKSFKSLFENINDLRQTDGATADIARTWGIISDAYNHHVLSEYVDNHYMPKNIRKWNDAFFKYTGLNWWTDFTRKSALAVGMDSIQQEALKAQTAPTQKQRDRATQFLGELGLTVSDVNRWVARGKPIWGSLTYNESNAENAASDRAVANAMVQFVDESILRPNPSQRPILASHPAMMLLYHLKGFMYAIHDTILKRLVHNFKIADTPAQIAAVFIPAVGMMLMTAIGLELRELVAGTRRTDRMDGWEYTWEVFERTGLPGLTQFAWDWEGASARGQSELAGVGGPTLSQFGDLISKPTSQTIPKSIPVVAQLPWARDMLRNVTPI